MLLNKYVIGIASWCQKSQRILDDYIKGRLNKEHNLILWIRAQFSVEQILQEQKQYFAPK